MKANLAWKIFFCLGLLTLAVRTEGKKAGKMKTKQLKGELMLLRCSLVKDFDLYCN